MEVFIEFVIKVKFYRKNKHSYPNEPILNPTRLRRRRKGSKKTTLIGQYILILSSESNMMSKILNGGSNS